MSNPFGLASFVDLGSQPQTPVKEAPVLCLISGSKGHLWLRRLPYLMCWWKKRRGLCKRQKSSGVSWMTRSLIDWATIVEFNGSLSKRGWNLKNAPNICIIIPLQWFLCQLSRVTLLNTWIFKIGYGLSILRNLASYLIKSYISINSSHFTGTLEALVSWLMCCSIILSTLNSMLIYFSVTREPYLTILSLSYSLIIS